VSSENSFEGLARLYDWEHDRFDDDLAVWVGFARRFGSPVLELACGTGRVLAALTRAGIDATGVDNSPDMLARARARQAGAELVEQDVRTLQVPRQFRTILIALDSFGLLLPRADQLAALEAARAHATFDGRLIVDVANGNLRGGSEPFDELVHQLTAPDPDTGRPITKWAVRTPEPAEQLDRLTVFYDETDAGGCVRRTTVAMQLRWFTRFELQLLLERSGWSVDEEYGGYDLSPFGDASERLLMVARAS